MQAEIAEVVLDTRTRYYIEPKRKEVKFIIEPQNHEDFYTRDNLKEFYETHKGETYMYIINFYIQ